MSLERWPEVKALFEAAIEHAPDERAAFLDEACAGDPSLRKAVEALLASDDQAGNFMQAPAYEVAAELLADHQDQSMVGRRIGPYQILREIGRGGVGAVYLAERTDGIQKQVAIKIIKRGMDTAAVLRRFRHEQQILASLDHPHMARFLDAGMTDDGLPYFVMDYVEGLPIGVYCDTQKLPTAERLKLFRLVCSVVHYAHKHQVVHRDLKPSNIFVTADGIPKLLDFGIAKVLYPGRACETVGTTATALRPMTPEYASPEQVRGEPVTPASDIYSLGVLLYELLTGHRPYHILGGTPQEIERVICEQEPEKPSTAIRRIEEVPGPDGATRITLTPESVSETREGSPERLRHQLSGDLDNIVLMALRKEPGRRYASVEEFSEDIRRHLEGLPVIARRDILGYRSAKFIKRNKAGVIAATLALALLVLIGVEHFWRPEHEPATNSETVLPKAVDSIAVLPLANLSGDPAQEYFADGMTEALINQLAQIRALRVISRTSAMQYKGVHKPLPEIARQLKVDAVVEGSVLRSEDRVQVIVQLIEGATDRHLWARTYERNLRDVIALQGEVAQAIAQEIKIKLTPQQELRMASNRPVDREAYEAYLKGRYYWNKRRGEDLKRAMDYFRQAIKKDPSYALAYAGLADAYGALPFNSDTPPKQAFPKAKEAATRALEIDDTLAEAHVSLGNTLTNYDWDWPSAEREFKRAIELNPNLPTAHQFYAAYLSAMGRHKEAIAEAKRSQELDPLSLITHALAGRCFYHARQYDQAIAQYRKALEIDPNFWVAHLFSGKAYGEKRMYREALTELQKAADVSTFGSEASSIMGYVLAVSGRADQAQKVLAELISLSNKGYIPPRLIVNIYAGLDQKDQALAWLEKAFEARDTRLIWLKVDPTLDHLRSDPHFGELLRRLQFPP